MMKVTVLLALALLMTIRMVGQNVAVNATGAPANGSAMLDIASEDKGVLIPRMSSAQRVSIPNPAMGLLVFDTQTRSFWFYTTEWIEIISGGSMGSAGGDLTGQYPDPSVAKLHGHTVSALTPLDRHVLKWDMADNMWKGMRDSLALPYSATASDATSLFSVTNTWNGFAYNTSILGRRQQGSIYNLNFSTAIWGDASVGTGILGTSNYHSGVFGKSQQNHGVAGLSEGGNGFAGVYGAQGTSGLTPGTTMGVWGDNAGGLGVVGTSQSGIGVYGFAHDNHGVYGYSTNIDWAGIKGSHANDGGTGIHGEVNHGTGILGEILYSGTGVYGRAVGDAGAAGRFRSIAPAHGDTTLVVSTNGLGKLGHYQVSNTSNQQPGIKIYHEGEGDGLLAVLTKYSSSAKAVNAFANGIGTALYGRSEFGLAGKFEIVNIGSISPAVAINNSGLGTGLDIVSTQGNGAAISVTSASSAGRGLDITNQGTGLTAYIKSLNAASDSTALRIDQAGLGNGLSVLVGNQNSQTSALSVVSAADWGITSTVFGKHAVHGYALGSNGIGVEGNASGMGAIGVKGVSTASSGGTGVIGEANVNDILGFGVKGIGRRGVYGEGRGGVGVHGKVGVVPMSSVAGFFENVYSENGLPVVQIESNGLGRALQVVNDNPGNLTTMVLVENHGTGGFMELRDGNTNAKMVVGHSGEIITDATIIVRENKGIVRNSTFTQLRVETVAAVFNADEPYETISPGEFREVSVTFSTAFSSPPSVYVANITQDGNARAMLASVKNVTSSGCKLYVINPMHYDVALYDSTWNLVAMGPE